MRLSGATPIALAIAAASVIAVFLIVVMKRRGSKYNLKFDACDYVVFETDPSLLATIRADLTPLRWRLLESKPGEGNALRYKFGKDSAHAAPLSRIFDFKRSMPATTNRISGADIIVKIKEYGNSRDLNA